MIWHVIDESVLVSFEHVRNSVILTENITFRFIASIDIGSEVERGETGDITYRYRSKINKFSIYVTKHMYLIWNYEIQANPSWYLAKQLMRNYEAQIAF